MRQEKKIKTEIYRDDKEIEKRENKINILTKNIGNGGSPLMNTT
jgi:hypothetical protein